MNCSELKNFINHYGIKAFCNNFSNLCSNSCINSNYDCNCACIDNSDDDNSSVNLYCNIKSYSMFDTLVMYIINIFLIIAFVIFCSACIGIFRRKYRAYKEKREYNVYLGLPTYQQSQNMPVLAPPPLPSYENQIEDNNHQVTDIAPPSYENQNKKNNEQQ